MPRVNKSSGKSRHDPLLVQLDEDGVEAKYGRVSQPGKRKKSKHRSNVDEDDSEVILDPKTSRRIFELAKDQQDELEMPEDADVAEEDLEDSREGLTRPRTQIAFDEEEDDDHFDVTGEEIEEEYEIDAGDMETLDALLPANSGERKTLADLIFAKLDTGEVTSTATIQKVHQDREAPDPAAGLNPSVVEAYTKIGLLLRSYKSGPLPKLFKVIPSLPAWARMLALTHPENWSPHACYAATKIFISNMKPAQAQLFLGVVLLDAIREDIRENKKMNVHYYQALKKSIYKPGAFFKGIIFPLLDQGCTLKEATIIASILARTKVPVLHASAALLRIAEMDYTGPNSLFIRVLIDKKFELPYKVIDALVFHFIRLSNSYKAKTRGDSEKLPVLWHQSLLVFAQRYASDLTPDQKDALLDVIRATPHPQISPEIRRELVNSVARHELTLAVHVSRLNFIKSQKDGLEFSVPIDPDNPPLLGLQRVLKDAQDPRRPVIGSWTMLPGAALARMVAQMGYDFVLVDCEHGNIDDAAMHASVGAIAAEGVSPIVRIPMLENVYVKRALDTGAHGILCPSISTADEARALVSYSKSPVATKPLSPTSSAMPSQAQSNDPKAKPALSGIRGVGSPFAPAVFRQTLEEYIRTANRNTLVAVQIETVEGVKNCEEIAKVDGIDMLFVGPNDLASSMGYPALSHKSIPEVQEAIERILAAAHDAGKYAGMFCTEAAHVRERFKQGFDLMNLGADIVALMEWNATQLAKLDDLMGKVISKGNER